MSSGGQWEALPQRRRKRRPAAAAGVGGAAPATATPADVSPRPPLHQQQQQQQQDTTLSLAPTPPSGATGALAATADLASGDHNPRLPAASSKVETRSTGNSADNEARPQQHQQQPCGNSDSKSERTAAVDGGGVTELSEKGPASATTTAPTASVPAEATARTGSTTQSGQGGREKNGRGQGPRGAGVIAPDAETVAARHAAVATAVEARSKMTRFAGGLEGGAGADGGSAGANFEYLDHTADVQLHSWGESIERAMEGALAALFNTITDIAKVDVDPSLTRVMEVEGHDAKSLLFSFLDEFLFLFHSEGLAVKRVTVNGTIDRDSGPNPRWRLKATAEGETFDLSKHPQGTEVKAITYSNMQINEAADGRADIYVIVDI